MIAENHPAVIYLVDSSNKLLLPYPLPEHTRRFTVAGQSSEPDACVSWFIVHLCAVNYELLSVCYMHTFVRFVSIWRCVSQNTEYGICTTAASSTLARNCILLFTYCEPLLCVWVCEHRCLLKQPTISSCAHIHRRTRVTLLHFVRSTIRESDKIVSNSKTEKRYEANVIRNEKRASRELRARARSLGTRCVKNAWRQPDTRIHTHTHTRFIVSLKCVAAAMTMNFSFFLFRLNALAMCIWLPLLHCQPPSFTIIMLLLRCSPFIQFIIICHDRHSLCLRIFIAHY